MKSCPAERIQNADRVCKYVTYSCGQYPRMAKGIVSMDNPYSLWTLGIPQKDYGVNKIFEEAGSWSVEWDMIW